MAFRPLLRPGLRRSLDRVEDPPTGLALPVPPGVAPLLALLDGRVDVEQALTTSGVDLDAGRTLLRSLALCCMLVGVDEGEREAMLLARAAGPGDEGLAFQVPTGSRFECGRCGACCRGAFMGPLDDAEVARLTALGGAGAVALEVVGREPAGLPLARRVLARRAGGACVFLEGDATCGVARALGADARPLGCRAFPWQVQPTPAGVFVSDRLECATASTSGAAGPPIYEAFAALRPLLREGARRAPLLSGAVELSSGIRAPATWARWALARAVEAFDATTSGGWLAALEVARDALLHFEVAAITTELGPRLWERIWARFEALPVKSLTAPPPESRLDPARAQAALEATLAAYAAATGPLASTSPDLAALAAGLAVARGPGREGEDELEPALRRAARQRLSGLPLEADGALARSLARALVASIATLGAARAAAQARGAGRCAAEDLDLAQPAVARAMRDPRLEPALSDDAARALVWGHAGLRL